MLEYSVRGANLWASFWKRRREEGLLLLPILSRSATVIVGIIDVCVS